MSDGAQLVCSLCSASFSSRHGLVEHIHQHLSYRKYKCSSCTQLFYTEEERYAHCQKKGHVNTFGMRVMPYCELYVNQFLKDIEHIASHGVDTVVVERSKANLTCDTALGKLPRKVNSKKRKSLVSTDHLQPSSSRENDKEDSSSDTSNTILPSRDNKKPFAARSQKQSKETRTRRRISSDDWMNIDVDNSTAISPATQILSEALRTKPSEVRCMICKTMTAFDYVLRKHHVSAVHMPKDHTESDYVEILSTLMQKAYPTMTYNDLQCQIGGCRKEYKCQAARRTHVLRIHFQHELSCPIDLCSFRSSDFSRVNSHLKEDHALASGYLSLQNGAVRDQFNADRAKHNHHLMTMVQMAFPCPIPESCKSGYKPVSDVISAGGIQDLIAQIRDKDRKFQSVPPNPLRLRSPSSSSDSDSSNDEASSSHMPKPKVNTGDNKPSESTTSKVKNNALMSPSEVDAEASGSSSTLESDEEEVEGGNVEAKPSLSVPSSNVTETLGKRKKADSPSSSSFSDSDNDVKKSRFSPMSNICVASVSSKNVKENEEQASDVDSMSNNASAKSDFGSESGDEVQIVEYVSNVAGKSSTEKPVIEEVVLDDDDEVERTNTPTNSTPLTVYPKLPTYRTLPISGVTVRTDIEPSPPLRSNGALSDQELSRTLPISGVTVRADGTPVRPYSNIYSGSFSADGGFMRREAAEASEQQERRRELARRKFDIAKETREVYHAIRKKKRAALANSKTSSTLVKVHKKRKSPYRSPKKRREKSNVSLKKDPSYTVVAVKSEVSSSSTSSAQTSSSWRGTIKRFDD